jgi:prolipoprotein diacylglyceryltransferase
MHVARCTLHVCYYYAVTIAFTLPGGVPVYAFSLLVGAGASLGFGRAILSAPGETRGRAAAAGFTLILIALAGSRIVYQFNHPAAPLELPLGGLSWGGAMLTGWLALPLVAKPAGIPAGRLADLMVPFAAAVLTAAWLGCWIDGAAYGPLSDAWYAVAARDDWGNLAARLPLQLGGAGLGLLTLAAAELLHRSIAKPGLTAGLWLTATGLQLFWLQSLRADPVPYFNGYPLNLWGAGATILLGVLITGSSLLDRPAQPVKA